MALVGHNLRCQVGLLIEIEQLTTAQYPQAAAQTAQDTIEAHEFLAVLIVEILPVHAAPERDTGIAALWQRVVLDDLLALPEHGDASAGVERDGKGLQLRHVCANAKGDIALPTDTGCSAKAVNQMFMVVRI